MDREVLEEDLEAAFKDACINTNKVVEIPPQIRQICLDQGRHRERAEILTFLRQMKLYDLATMIQDGEHHI